MRPILFHIGSFPVRSYGTMLVLGFLLCLWRSMRVCEARQKTEPEGSPRRIAPDDAFDVGILGLIFGLLGARLLFVLLDWGSFVQHPLEAFKVWAGGLSLHGGMLGGILTVIVYAKRKRISLPALLDLGAPAFALAYAFGRIGCFLNGCCYGAVCDLPWAVRFHNENGPGLTPPSHPVQLYGTLINFVFFYLLTRWEKRPRRDGEIFWGYIAMYGAYRGLVEFWRAGATSTYLIPALRLTDTHVISLLMVVAGITGIAWLRGHRPAVQDAAAAPA